MTQQIADIMLAPSEYAACIEVKAGRVAGRDPLSRIYDLVFKRTIIDPPQARCYQPMSAMPGREVL
jgi:hypothetical protein